MVLYIFPSELFIVFPDGFHFPCQIHRELTRVVFFIPPGMHDKEKEEPFPPPYLFDLLDLLRENCIKKCRNAITGLQVSSEDRHPGIVPVDV